MILLMIWLGVALTVNGLAGLSGLTAAALGLAGTLLILCVSYAYAWRFRDR